MPHFSRVTSCGILQTLLRMANYLMLAPTWLYFLKTFSSQVVVAYNTQL